MCYVCEYSAAFYFLQATVNVAAVSEMIGYKNRATVNVGVLRGVLNTRACGDKHSKSDTVL